MPKDALTMKYNPKVNTREYNTFTEEYFAGADVALYLDGEVVTQISGLQYTVSEQQKPIFGYASRTFDDIAVGNRIVVGSFRVPISNPKTSASFKSLTSLDSDGSNSGSGSTGSGSSYGGGSNPSTRPYPGTTTDTDPNIYPGTDPYTYPVIDPNTDTNTDLDTGSDSTGNTYPTIPSNPYDPGSGPTNPGGYSWVENCKQYGSVTYKGSESSQGTPDPVPSGEDIGYSSPLQYSEPLKIVQKKLIQLGYNVDVNGFYDAKTRKAVKAFQTSRGLNETSVLDAETKAAILSEGESLDGMYAVTRFDGVTLRNGPGSEYKSLEELSDGERLLILATVNEWLQVKLYSGIKGYIAKSLVQVVE